MQIGEWERIQERNQTAIFAPVVEALRRAAEKDWESAHHIVANLIGVAKGIATAQIGWKLSVEAELFARVRQAHARRALVGEPPVPSPDYHQGIAETPDKQHRGALRNV